MADMEDENDTRRTRGKAKVVGRGLLAPFRNPQDPQWYLAYSEHPYAPFPGNALKWDSFVYDDGTTYEGLTRENTPHGKGVMMFGEGTGGGIQTVSKGDKYEGEFFGGFANGLGALTTKKGEVYRGEWLYGKRHGCGAATDFTAFHREIQRGATPQEAWKKTRNYILNNRMIYGQWERNKFIAPSSSSENDPCSVHMIRGLLQEMESVVTKSRWFQHKPDGDVTHVARRDKEGKPIPTFQDPLHYPHNTTFLAPGPIGQCYPIPDEPVLKRELAKHARNFLRIFNSYNLPYLAQPGDDLFAAARRESIVQARKELYDRLSAGEDQDTVLADLERKHQMPSAEFQEYLDSKTKKSRGKEDAKKAREEAARQKQRQQQAKATNKRAQRQRPQAVQEEDDDDDLLASVSGVEESEGGNGNGLTPPSVFCSLSGRSHHLTQAVQAVARRAQDEFLPRIQRRAPLGRRKD